MHLVYMVNRFLVWDNPPDVLRRRAVLIIIFIWAKLNVHVITVFILLHVLLQWRRHDAFKATWTIRAVLTRCSLRLHGHRLVRAAFNLLLDLVIDILKQHAQLATSLRRSTKRAIVLIRNVALRVIESFQFYRFDWVSLVCDDYVLI